MKDQSRSFPRLVSVPALTLTLICAGAAQSPSGSYGFVAGVLQIDSNGDNGAAILGVMNFDGAGKMTGTATIKPRSTRDEDAQAGTSAFTGTYSTNPDGAGRVTLAFDLGITLTFAMVTTDGGQGLQLLSTDCIPCGADFPLRGTAQSLSGGLPISLFLQGASGSVTGNVPLSLSGVSSADGGTTVYTAAAATGSGTAQCRDGDSGACDTLPPPEGIAGFRTSFGTVCSRANFNTLSGLVTGTVSPGGATSLVLHGTGAVISGIGRPARGGGSLNGSYGVQLNYAPLPAGTIGVMKFDGAGSVAASLTSVGGANSSPGTATLTGTYSIKSDGSGTISLKAASDQAAGPAFAFVITDSGTQLLLLRTDNNAGFDVSFGTARLQ